MLLSLLAASVLMLVFARKCALYLFYDCVFVLMQHARHGQGYPGQIDTTDGGNVF